jgi:HK97 family phage major capsid protein
MSTILELRDRRAKLWDTAKNFLDTHRKADGLVSAEDNATYDKMETDMVALGREIERLERQSAIDLELAKPTSAPITNAPQKQESAKTGRASDEYRREFGNALRGRAITNVLSEGVDADGGYLVPDEFERQIVAALQEANIIRSLAKTITTAAPHKITLAGTGSTAAWVAENGAVPDQTPQFGQKVLDAFKLTDLVKISVELLQDSAFDVEGYLIAEYARAFGAAEEEAFCVGTGTGQPTGLFTATGGASVGVTASSASAITLDNVLDLVYALKSPYRRNASFLMKDATVAVLRKLKDSNGNFLWQPSVQQGQPDRLLGYPLYTSPYAPAVAANALPVAFGDFSSYWIADRMGRTVQRLNELYAGNGQVGFLALERVDGKIVVSEGILLLKMAAGS